MFNFNKGGYPIEDIVQIYSLNNMKRFLSIVFLLLPFFVLSQKNIDSVYIRENKESFNKLNDDFVIVKDRYEYLIKVNEQTLNSISNQIEATSFNLSIFAFLFGILAIVLGIYVTWVERKISKFRDESKDLLRQTIDTKNEVVAINELIHKDIYGLFVKIKREETLHILNRLVKIPEDITNLSNELLSRDLKQEDFSLLKKAYLKLKSKPKKEPKHEEIFLSLKVEYDKTYLLLFFQHFLDLSLKDVEINPDLTDYYKEAIECAFENDIIKSTEDFSKAIIDLGFQTKQNEINCFFKALAVSKFNNLKTLYKIIYDYLSLKDDKFKFYLLLDESKEIRIAKINFGKLLLLEFDKTELSVSEIKVIDNVKFLEKELKEEEKRLVEEKELDSNK